MRLRFMTLRAAAAALLVAAASQSLAAETKALRPEVGKPLKSAQDALQAGKAQQALGDIQQADAVSGKSAYEQSIINQMKQSAYIKLSDWGNVVKATDAILAEGDTPDPARQYLILATAYYQLKDWAKVPDAANKYYKAGGTDPGPRSYATNALYSSGNYAEAAKAKRAEIAEQEKAGQKPKEDDLKVLLAAEFNMLGGVKSSPGYLDALLKLQQYYPKPDGSYLHDAVLDAVKRPGYSDKLDLDIDAIRVQAGNQLGGTEYMEAAEAQVQAGFPANAKAILDAGNKAGAFASGPDAARSKKLMDLTVRQISDDQKTLDAEEKGAKTGTQYLKLGDALLSYGMTDRAIAAYQNATKAGGFKNPVEANIARIHLGRAQAAAGQKPQAKQTLAGLSGQTDGSAEVAQIWSSLLGLRS